MPACPFDREYRCVGGCPQRPSGPCILSSWVPPLPRQPRTSTNAPPSDAPRNNCPPTAPQDLTHC
eukprot:10532658-Lingulodinium_polyedra.AAC.1